MTVYYVDFCECERRFAKLERKLRKVEGDSANGICNNLISDMACILKYWCQEQNAMRKNVRLSSPSSILIVQEFLNSYGMHLERISPEDSEERVFKIVPNW